MIHKRKIFVSIALTVLLVLFVYDVMNDMTGSTLASGLMGAAVKFASRVCVKVLAKDIVVLLLIA
jgi:hypothetical protein